MYEQTKRIQCPGCGVLLDVRNLQQEQGKIITCPQCKAMLKVKFREMSQKMEQGQQNMQQEPLEAHTYLAGKLLGGETQLAARKTATPKQPSLVVNGQTYRLSEGCNTIGRKASNSKAAVQIETSDHYMSRQHAMVQVMRLSDGGIRSIISNDKNKNITAVNGQELQQDDQIFLSDGDRITMGKTIITYLER